MAWGGGTCTLASDLAAPQLLPPCALPSQRLSWPRSGLWAPGVPSVMWTRDEGVQGVFGTQRLGRPPGGWPRCAKQVAVSSCFLHHRGRWGPGLCSQKSRPIPLLSPRVACGLSLSPTVPSRPHLIPGGQRQETRAVGTPPTRDESSVPRCKLTSRVLTWKTPAHPPAPTRPSTFLK